MSTPSADDIGEVRTERLDHILEITVDRANLVAEVQKLLAR